MNRCGCQIVVGQERLTRALLGYLSERDELDLFSADHQ